MTLIYSLWHPQYRTTATATKPGSNSSSWIDYSQRSLLILVIYVCMFVYTNLYIIVHKDVLKFWYWLLKFVLQTDKQMFENGWLCVMIFATNYLKIDILCLCSKLQLNTNFTVFGKRMRKIFATNEFNFNFKINIGIKIHNLNS